MSDLIASEGKYHLHCYSAFVRRYQKGAGKNRCLNDSFGICFRNVAEEVLTGLSKGHIYTMNAIWERYTSMLRYDFEICTKICDRQARSKFRYKIKISLGDNADLVQSLNPQEFFLVVPAKSAGIAVQHLKEMAEDMLSSEDESTLKHTTQAPEDKKH